MTNIDLILQPRRDAILAAHDNSLDVLVCAQAPDASEHAVARQPFNLVLVIDRSGSMSGQPLDEAKRCASMIIDGLGPTDRLSIVTFDDEVDVLVAPRLVTDRSAFHRVVQGIQCGGTTALHEGWLRGAEQAAMCANDTTLTRVLLLSDGQANVGLTNIETIAQQCGVMASEGVRTSTYGLGHDFNEELMAAMARKGRGNAYYGSTADDLMDPFRQEFDLLFSLCARDLRAVLAPAEGVRVEVLNRYEVDHDGEIRLPDLAFGGEAWALLRLTVPRSVIERTDTELVHLLTVNLRHRNLEGKEEMAGPVHLRLPRLPAQAFEAIVPDELVGQRSAELEAARLQETARLAARRGDWNEVEASMEQLRSIAKSSPWLSATIRGLEQYVRYRQTERFSKEALYSAHMMSTRLAAKGESSNWGYDQEGSKASFLRRKLEQGKRFDRDRDADGRPDGDV